MVCNRNYIGYQIAKLHNISRTTKNSTKKIAGKNVKIKFADQISRGKPGMTLAVWLPRFFCAIFFEKKNGERFAGVNRKA